ncbi:MAG: hypothetical protein Harvfovirus17_7 [Harvfovirus sp.]|uniref:Uncharacterized protein n=1 Tax=Harvfovirus sp. TaxID=2487768 RepID=A0A3G5A5M2_9VIRU|nr:MAG: hypothetical protein Harvfovirus17_7 [Harvfovirus sp.]
MDDDLILFVKKINIIIPDWYVLGNTLCNLQRNNESDNGEQVEYSHSNNICAVLAYLQDSKLVEEFIHFRDWYASTILCCAAGFGRDNLIRTIANNSDLSALIIAWHSAIFSYNLSSLIILSEYFDYLNIDSNVLNDLSRKSIYNCIWRLNPVGKLDRIRKEKLYQLHWIKKYTWNVENALRILNFLKGRIPRIKYYGDGDRKIIRILVAVYNWAICDDELHHSGCVRIQEFLIGELRADLIEMDAADWCFRNHRYGNPNEKREICLIVGMKGRRLPMSFANERLNGDTIDIFNRCLFLSRSGVNLAEIPAFDMDAYNDKLKTFHDTINFIGLYPVLREIITDYYAEHMFETSKILTTCSKINK